MAHMSLCASILFFLSEEGGGGEGGEGEIKRVRCHVAEVYFGTWTRQQNEPDTQLGPYICMMSK